MDDKKLTFKEAFERLKEIYLYLKTNEIIDVDEMINLQKEAEELYKFCKDKLKKIEKKE